MIAPPDILKTLMRLAILALVVGLLRAVPGQVVHADDKRRGVKHGLLGLYHLVRAVYTIHSQGAAHTATLSS